MGQGERALDIVGDRFSRSVGEVIHRQDDHVVANADATVLAQITRKFGKSHEVPLVLTSAWS